MPEPRDEKYWRERATDAKARAATFTTSALKTDLLAPELKAELLALAERYERLADHSAARSRRLGRLRLGLRQDDA